MVIIKKIGGDVKWLTCVGGYVFLDRLKGQSAGGGWDDLSRLSNTLTLNGAPEEPTFIIKINHNDMEY